jgi:DNA polymerase-3 subunit delta'
MSEEAQNALLKNLEEPPEKVVFLITTSQPSGLRKTVLSRCWRISLDSLSDKDVVKILTEYFKVDKSIAENVAPFAEGSVTVAMKLIDMDFINLKEKTISILRNAFGKKYYTAYDELNSLIVEDPATNLEAVIKMIIIWLNDLNRYRLNQNQFFFRDNIETLQKFQEKFPTVGINELLFELDNFSNLINRNINTNTLSSNLIFQLSNLILGKHSN